MDEQIYVGRPDLLDLDHDVVDFAELDGALAEAASGATEITILGGYYNADALLALCRNVPRGRRPECKVRIAVGLEAMALIPRTWEEMRAVYRKLRTSGFRDVTVAVVGRSPTHFHTKLFRFLRTKRPIWFVGSANPGSGRHELMVRISGRHEALLGYVDAVFNKAQTVADQKPPPTTITTLRDFFLTGMLCHKPPAQRLFTFDAFRFEPHHRDRLATALAGGAGVEHARPTAQGFGFSLRSALNPPDAQPSDEDETARRIHYRPSCVDTVFGFWMPQAYADEIRALVHEEEASRLRRLEGLAQVLGDDAGQAVARSAFEVHVTSMERFLAVHQIDAQPVLRHRPTAFKDFLSSRTRTLASADARVRHSRAMTLADMPNIWEDQRAVEEFETSFFEDLAYRASLLAGNRARVVRSIVDALPGKGLLETADELRDALSARLARKPWDEDEWKF